MQAKQESAAQRVGANVTLYRERADMPKVALVRTMAERGFAWHSVTLSRIEGGVQSLKLEEAAALADIFGVPVHLFLLPPAETQATDALYAVRRSVLSAHEALAAAAVALLEAGSAAEHRARLFDQHDSPRVQEAREDALAAVSEYDIDSAVAEGVRRYGEGRPPGG